MEQLYNKTGYFDFTFKNKFKITGYSGGTALITPPTLTFTNELDSSGNKTGNIITFEEIESSDYHLYEEKVCWYNNKFVRAKDIGDFDYNNFKIEYQVDLSSNDQLELDGSGNIGNGLMNDINSGKYSYEESTIVFFEFDNMIAVSIENLKTILFKEEDFTFKYSDTTFIDENNLVYFYPFGLETYDKLVVGQEYEKTYLKTNSK